MNPLLLRAPLFLLAAGLLAACQTAPPTPEPKILSSTRSEGKGVPNGRSDSAAPYLRIKLQPATDPQYGYSPGKPIRTAPRAAGLHIAYLNALRGPKGEPVTYERRGACCEFEDKSLPLGGGLLDVYKLQVDGSNDVLTLYVDMYRSGPPQVPAGLTMRK